MPGWLERLAEVVLRLPPVVLLDLLYRWDVQAFADAGRPLAGRLQLPSGRLWSLYYAGHLLCLVVVLLPLCSLVQLYLRLVALLLLYLAHQAAWDYLDHEVERGFQGAIYEDPVALGHFATALTGQVAVVALCARLLKTRQVGLLCAPLLPLAARLCCLPPQTLPTVSRCGAAVAALELLYGAADDLRGLLRRAAAGCREFLQDPGPFRLVTLAVSLWRRLAVPLVFSAFWLVLFTLQIFTLAASFSSSSSGHFLSQQGWIFVFLSSVAKCCSTPYSLLGLTFAVSYLALGLLQLGKLYLTGFGAFQEGSVMHRGVTEGVTLLLLAIQTGLLGLQLLQRTYLLTIILFIVATSTLQSMSDIAEPFLLALGASQSRNFWKHVRGVSLCLFLLGAPVFMAYKIAHFFQLDFWLLILISSCLLTSLQVLGTLFVYGLFMMEPLQGTSWEKMEEILYGVHALSRTLEFLVALCVVAYGTWGSVAGEWTWLGASVILIHCYFNVWLRARSGWRSFSLRWEAAKKISLLSRATAGQLRDHNDLCAICFQEMTLAVIMPCSHFFHEGCLRKWFYVQDTCPLCHQAVQIPASQEIQRGGGAGPEGRPQPERGMSVGHQKTGDSNHDGSTSSDTEQPGLWPVGSAGEDPQLGHSPRGALPRLSPPQGRAPTAEESDQMPLRESLQRLGESVEIWPLGQPPLQSELKLSSGQRDTSPP
ncbi:RING finger protein 145-like [Crotalus tigris]|uniref:RING finger protein 145-like n=1 Tax=Crotalus tigris TaxID=88082 RepID=UPI00192F92A8|nr:RING finger protein 145-like [Crotalus tigris]